MYAVPSFIACRKLTRIPFPERPTLPAGAELDAALAVSSDAAGAVAALEQPATASVTAVATAMLTSERVLRYTAFPSSGLPFETRPSP
jgi:hypothetical protein